MWTLFQIELFKIFRRPRTYIAFAAITALIGMVQLGLKVDGQEYASFVMADFNSSFALEGNLLNGYFVCFIVLQLLLVHVPLLIALIAADMISGEANTGTLRLLMSKPVSRVEFILAKYLASVVYTIMLLVWVALQALFLSMLIFGTDDMFIMKSSYAVLIKSGDVFWRYAGAFCFAALAMGRRRGRALYRYCRLVFVDARGRGTTGRHLFHSLFAGARMASKRGRARTRESWAPHSSGKRYRFDTARRKRNACGIRFSIGSNA